MLSKTSDFRITAKDDCNIVMTRSFNAPIADVMRAYLDPALVKQWLSHPGMPLVVCEIDARIGGAFRYTWQMQDGTVMTLYGLFTEITLTRIVHTELFEPDWTGGETIETMDFIAQGDRTLIHSEIVYSSLANRDAALNSGMGEGMAECFDRMEALI